MSQPATSDNNLASEWLTRFVTLLLNCPTMQTPTGRRLVRQQLPDNLKFDVADQNETSDRQAVTDLAYHCAGKEGGLEGLLTTLTEFDGETNTVPPLLTFLQAHPAPSPSAFPQDATSREASIRNSSIGTGTYNEGSIQATIEGGIGVVGSTVTGNITYNDYRQSGPAQPARSPLVPPDPPEHFAGRERELKELAEMLGQSEGGGVALMALRGQGGIGKTTLARQVAYQLYTEKVFGAVLWVEVKPKFDPWPVLRRWAAHCGVAIDEANPDWPTVAGKVRAGLSQLTQGRALVVFDDVWADGVVGVRQLREALPPVVTLLTTSRDERVGLALKARRVEVGTLPTSEAVALLRVYLDDGELPQAGLEELAERLKGHALALTLAAKRLNRESHPATALTRHLRQYAQGLPTGSAITRLQMGEEFTEREDSLELALAYSYDTLTEDRQARFRALGALVYDQPFDLNILLGLWEVPAKKAEGEPAEDTAREWAEELRDFSLLEAVTENDLGEGWYNQHPILHAYAAALLQTNPGEKATARYCYYDRTITIARPFFELRNKPEEWGFLTPYLPHIHEAGDALYALHKARPDQEAIARRVLAFATNVYWYLARRQEVHKREWLEMGLAAAHIFGDRFAKILFLSGLALYYQQRDHTTEALTYHEQSLAISREENDLEGEATTLTNIGRLYSDQGKKTTALSYFEQALSLIRDTGNHKGEATILSNIGVIYSDLGDKQKALAYYEQALPLLKATGDRSGEANTLNNIGKVYVDLGDKQKALTFFEQALLLLKSIGDQADEATILSNLGAIYSDLGDKQKALTFFKLALDLTRATGDRSGEATTLNNMGLLLWEDGRREEGLQIVEQAQKLFEQVGSPNAQVVAAYVTQMRQALNQK